jgi:hypothetical protein
VPAGATAGRIEYRVTGHGGGTDATCIGPAEEFCRRAHSVFVDNQKLKDLDPWRSDCTKLCTLAKSGNLTYCMENPCGALASVRAPRANWCPGSETPPFVLETDALTASGPHSFSFTISTVATGGTWRISAVYLAFGS